MTQQAKTKALGSLHQTLLSHYVVDFLGCTDQDTTQLKTLDVYKLPVVEIELYERCMQTLRAFSHLPQPCVIAAIHFFNIMNLTSSFA